MVSETITACENICRDFSWFGSVSDWIPFFASLVVVCGGLWGYRIQKRLERLETFHSAKRENYHRFLASYSECINAVTVTRMGIVDYPEQKIRAIRQELAILSLYADEVVLDAAKKVVTQVSSQNGMPLKESLDRDLKVQELSEIMRNDLLKREKNK